MDIQLAPSQPQAAPSCAADQSVATSPEIAPRLLIVDDIADNRAILARRFQRRGFLIEEASSGADALALMETRPFDTVLLDVMMPEMDGLEVLQRIRQTHSASALPVIMVTAKSQSDDVVQALTLGANDYVTKPVDFNVALARVSSQVERKRAEHEARQSAERLLQMNQELESRVHERTASLLAANRQLESEIAEREKSQARNQYLARHDILTGLGNRLLFGETLTRALTGRGGEPGKVCVLFIDLDGFKSVNDALGHGIGDGLLKLVAERLRSVVAAPEAVARLGGDEFALMLVSQDGVRPAAELADQLIALLAEPAEIGGHPVHVGASIGIAVEDPRCATPEDMVKAADMAMYRAKTEGRGVWRLYDPAMDACAQERRMLEVDLRNALNEGELALFYQPLVDLKTTRIVGFEALMRWRHPVRGYVSPADFIPVAEDLGLIVPLGEWALRQACMEAMKWPAEVKVAVNLSPIQFLRGNLVPAVVSALASSGLAPQRLELEITESVMLDKTADNVDTLKSLRELGVRIAMDDFGTGYSSLSYLRSFPFDKIKIDQSFIRDIEHDADSRAIVAAITGLGTSFGMTITAEGVETQAQFDRLSSNGCVEVQGHFISKPVPADEVAGLLVSRCSVSAEEKPDQGASGIRGALAGGA
jgi:diguanylate cyclase (GGDEF)-like protein